MKDNVVYLTVEKKIKPPTPVDWNDANTIPYGARRPLIATDATPVKKKREKIGGPLNPNAGLRVWYRKRLEAMIDAMHRSVMKWVIAAYNANEPAISELAADATPSAEIKKLIDKLTDRWFRQFDKGAKELADYFALAANKRTDAALQSILERAGFSIGKFKMTPAQRDVIEAAVNENVGLIKSIPEQYLKNVEGDVMRAVQVGGATGDLAKKLEANYGVSMRRAKFIARDQTAKATSVMGRARYLELGVEKAIWRHSRAGKVPRKSHLHNDGKEYSVSEGWWDPDVGEFIQPGQLINCFPGSTKIDLADGVEVAYRRWYSGHLTEFVTESGKTICATFNHPVLTPNGWVAAGALNEGDYVIEIRKEGVNFGMLKNDLDDAIPTIAEIFDALGNAGVTKSAIGTAAQFHGDGVVDSDVDVVLAARVLRFGRKTFLEQGTIQFDLAVTNKSALSFGTLKEAFASILGTASSFLRGLGEPFATSGAGLGHTQIHSFASGTHGTSSRFYSSDNGMSRNGVFPSKLENADAALVLTPEPVRIIHINRKPFDGHVYNLQTKGGWYVVGNAIVQNCRCTSKPIIPGFI